jgi:hypothetical protein
MFVGPAWRSTELRKAGSKPGVPLYFTARGSNKNEIMHRRLRQCVSATTSGVARVDHFVGCFVHRYNIDRGIDKLGIRDYHTYQHETLAAINSTCGSLGAPLEFPCLKISNHKPDEKIGFECQSLKVIDDEADDRDEPLDACSTEFSISREIMNVVDIRKDEDSLSRAFMYALGDFPDNVLPREGSDTATMEFMCAQRERAARHLRDHRNSLISVRDYAALADLDALLEVRHRDFDAWFEERISSNKLTFNDHAGKGGLLLLMALAMMFNVHVSYTIRRPDGTIVESDRNVFLHKSDDLDAASIHLLQEEESEMFGVVCAAKPQVSNNDDATLLKKIRKSRAPQTSYGYFGEVSRLANKAPTPFTDEPSGADERQLFEELHADFNRANSDSYLKFATKWGERVYVEAERANRGEQHLQLRLKSISMFYDWYDKKYKVVHSSDDPIVKDGACSRIAQEQNKSRVSAQPAAPSVPRETRPSASPCCPSISGHVPFGQRSSMPFNLGALPQTNENATAAPLAFQVGVPAKPYVPRPDGRRACSTCGKPRGDHEVGHYGQNCNIAMPPPVSNAHPPQRMQQPAPRFTPHFAPPPRPTTHNHLWGFSSISRAWPPRVLRRHNPNGHCWAEGVAFMCCLKRGIPLPRDFHLHMRDVASRNMRSDTYSAGIAIRMNIIRSTGTTLRMQAAQFEVARRGDLVNCSEARMPSTAYWGDIEEIMGLATEAPGAIYCFNPLQDYVERIDVHYQQHLNSKMVSSLMINDPNFFLSKSSLSTPVLVFNGRNHWDSYVPTVPY